MVELLVLHGYEVLGILRGPRDRPLTNLTSVLDKIGLAWADLADTEKLAGHIENFQPNEVYNFASVSFGPDAWEDPAETARSGTVAFVGLLESIRRLAPEARFFQASSSWVFGQPTEAPQNENTPYRPRDPYGAAKAYGDFILGGYRQRYGLFACSGILFNHESPRRSPRYVSRKITSAAARISCGLQSELLLGDLDAERDWGYAKDYVDLAWRALQHDVPADYVVGTGTLHAVRDFVTIAFGLVDLDWRDHVRLDRSLLRSSADVTTLVADASLARESLSWSPSTSFESLVGLMVTHDLSELDRGF